MDRLFSLGHHAFLDIAKNRVSDGRLIIGFLLEVTVRHLGNRPVFQLHPVPSRRFMTGVVGLIPSSCHFRRGIVTMVSWGPIVHRLERDVSTGRFRDMLPEKREDREAAADETASYFSITIHTQLEPETCSVGEIKTSGAYPKRPVSICT